VCVCGCVCVAVCGCVDEEVCEGVVTAYTIYSRNTYCIHVCTQVDHYTAPPPHEEMSNNYDGQPLHQSWETSTRWWYPVVHSQSIPVRLDKNKSKCGSKVIVVETVQLTHTVSTVGYIIYERRRKIIPAVLKRLVSECGSDKKALGKRIQHARTSGEEVECDIDIPICAFICDTTTQALKCGLHSSRILAAPVVIVECTYLEECYTSEANRRGHVVWSGEEGLCSVVRDQIFPTTHESTSECSSECSSVRQPVTFILIHFSLRYSDSSVVDFFMDMDAVGLGSAVTTHGSGPPHVVLWLDSGVVQLWYHY
jgi:hypothetical protein